MAEIGRRPHFPEGNRIPPQRGGIRFNVQTDRPARTGRTPTVGRTPIDTYPSAVEPAIVSDRVIAPDTPVRTKHDPTIEEAQDANAGKLLGKTENAILKFAKRHPLATAGGAAAALAGGFAVSQAIQSNDNTPGIHESIPKGSSFDSSATSTNPDSIFSKGAENVVIGDNNIIDTTLQRIQSLPDFDADGSSLILLAAPSKGKTATYSRTADWSGLATNSPRPADNQYNTITIGIEANQPIPMPHDGYLFVAMHPYKPDVIALVRIFYLFPNGNIANINFDTGYTSTQLPEEIKNAPTTKGGTEIYQNNNWKKGLPLKKGMPALINLADGMKARYTIGEFDPIVGYGIPTNIKTLTIDGRLPRVQ